MAELLRHRQTKEAATDMFTLQPPRHIPTLPILLQKSAILVVGLPLRPLEADSDYSFSHWTLVGV